MMHPHGLPPIKSPSERRHEALTQGYAEVGDPAASNQLEALKRRASNLTTKIEVPTADEASNLPDELG